MTVSINYRNILITFLIVVSGIIIGSGQQIPTIPQISIGIPTELTSFAIVVFAGSIALYLIFMFSGLGGCCGRMA